LAARLRRVQLSGHGYVDRHEALLI